MTTGRAAALARSARSSGNYQRRSTRRQIVVHSGDLRVGPVRPPVEASTRTFHDDGALRGLRGRCGDLLAVDVSNQSGESGLGLALGPLEVSR